MESQSVPISAVVATRRRAEPLRRTLAAFAAQSVQPSEWIIVDASDDRQTEDLCAAGGTVVSDRPVIRYLRAAVRGAASQRNAGFARALERFVLFVDDDVLPEPDCLARMWRAMEQNPQMGGSMP